MNYALSFLGQSLWWLVTQFVLTVGWPGIVAGVAGIALLLSLSTKAVRFFNTREGMALTAAVLLAALALIRFTRPGPKVATPTNGPVAVRQQPHKVKQVEADSQPAQPEEESEQLAEEATRHKPLAGKAMPVLPLMPLPVPAEQAAVIVPPSPVITPHSPIILSQAPHAAPHRAKAHQSHVTSPKSHAPATRGNQAGMLGSQPVVPFGQGNELTPKQARALENRIINDQIKHAPMFNPWNFGMGNSGGMQPATGSMGGMGQVPPRGMNHLPAGGTGRNAGRR